MERVVAWSGIALLAGLSVLTVFAWRDYRDTTVPSFAPRPALAVSARAAAVESRTVRPAATRRRQPSRASDTVALTATRGDCWLEVRRGDDVLYTGTLVQGQTRRFSGRTLELTLGAPENIDARLRGKPVRDFPQGSSTVVLTDGRLRSTPIS